MLCQFFVPPPPIPLPRGDKDILVLVQLLNFPVWNKLIVPQIFQFSAGGKFYFINRTTYEFNFGKGPAFRQFLIEVIYMRRSPKYTAKLWVLAILYVPKYQSHATTRVPVLNLRSSSKT